MSTQHVETLIIGGGQAGLVTAYHLQRRGRECLVLEADLRIGDVWRRRFDSLRLFTPARYDALPGLPLPMAGSAFPTGHEMGDYLERYAETMQLPIRTGITVGRLTRDDERYRVQAGSETFTADQVVVASGTWQLPTVPDFAPELDPSIRQMHSSDYRNPSQLQPGPVLVVGASHSGGDIALELSATRKTHLAGRIHGEIPIDIEGRPARVVFPAIWFVWNHVLTLRNPLGRKTREHILHAGAPLLRVKRADLAGAGVELTEHRVVGVSEGKPQLADGTVLDVANVVWCTGFGKDTTWIDLPIGAGDWPDHVRGVATGLPGLYFVGLPFLQGFYSMLVGGVTRDGEYVARHIDKRTRGRRAAIAVPEQVRTADREPSRERI
ncbi:MAG TPA: NAD(P)/FAD-dependent oxidoreductase [Frankiaceae bacterium]|nr:NAD(P)/FAD-dependent oxidoreductase [Frankiaceae bacterium]